MLHLTYLRTYGMYVRCSTVRSNCYTVRTQVSLRTNNTSSSTALHLRVECYTWHRVSLLAICRHLACWHGQSVSVCCDVNLECMMPIAEWVLTVILANVKILLRPKSLKNGRFLSIHAFLVTPLCDSYSSRPAVVEVIQIMMWIQHCTRQQWTLSKINQ